MGGLPFPTPGDLPDLGIEPVSLASPVVILSKGRKWIFFKIVWHTHSSGSRDLFLCLRKFPFSPESSKCTRDKTSCFYIKA